MQARAGRSTQPLVPPTSVKGRKGRQQHPATSPAAPPHWATPFEASEDAAPLRWSRPRSSRAAAAVLITPVKGCDGRPQQPAAGPGGGPAHARRAWRAETRPRSRPCLSRAARPAAPINSDDPALIDSDPALIDSDTTLVDSLD